MRIGLFTDTYYPLISGVVTSLSMIKENMEKLANDVYVFTNSFLPLYKTPIDWRTKFECVIC